MLDLSSIAFASPWVLGGLLTLPIIWWLLRVTPPAARVVRFPAIELLRDLIAREETSARTPLWLILLRILIVGLVVVALAKPLLNPDQEMAGSGPVVIILDNGWSSAKSWPTRLAALEMLLGRAERYGRSILLLTTAPEATDSGHDDPGPLPPSEVRKRLQGLTPMPWPADYEQVVERLQGMSFAGAVHGVWLSDGLDGLGVRALAEHLQRLGGVEIMAPAGGQLAHLLMPPSLQGTALATRVWRAEAGYPAVRNVRLVAGDGRVLARESADFGESALVADIRFALPMELRNQAARIEIEGEATAGATVLLDGRWRRRPVGIVMDGGGESNQPLLSELHYISRALDPYSEVRQGTLGDLLGRELAVLLLPDGALVSADGQARLRAWVEQGGMLVRFAGPRLAREPDELIPVRLRRGDRTLGGALSWTTPAHLAPFDANTPFGGLAVPEEVTVSRQVLAEPALDLSQKTWARLEDGTPLVTAERLERGWLVLIHTTGGPEWSNLSLSGLFVEMLQRLVSLSEGVGAMHADPHLIPIETMDGFGRLGEPAATARAIKADDFEGQRVSARHPPGYYGTPEDRRALNLSGGLGGVRPLIDLPPGVEAEAYGDRKEVDLMPWLLVAACGLLCLDLVLSLALRGYFRGGRRAARVSRAMCVVVAAVVVAGPAHADDDFAIKATTNIYLAYVVTGDPLVDRTSEAGLMGLAQVLNQRTAVEAAGAVAVDPDQHELSFLPLLYWPVLANDRALSEKVRERVNTYLRNGGTILFDTRDQNFASARFGGGPGNEALQRLVEGLEIPPLVPVSAEHVLTKSFYLLQDFPGRYRGGTLWVERDGSQRNDGVSPVVVGSNDYAAAWAVDRGRHVFATIPGGERQREMAYRFGVNLVMYALTGNYKADQVHVPAILERLGQ